MYMSTSGNVLALLPSKSFLEDTYNKFNKKKHETLRVLKELEGYNSNINLGGHFKKISEIHCKKVPNVAKGLVGYCVIIYTVTILT